MDKTASPFLILKKENCMRQNAVVMIDVECIGNAGGFRSRMDDGVKFGEFELGWAAT